MKINKEISAEMLLAYLYPESDRLWNVNCQGTFYRNYNGDAMFVDPDSHEVELARDGFLKTLPDNMFSDKDELRNSGKGVREAHDDLSWRQKLLKEVFGPMDSHHFKQRVAMERQVSELLRDKESVILKEYFDCDGDVMEDPYVRKAAAMLPVLRNRRGDLQTVRELLSSILHCDVTVDLSHRFSEKESDRVWMPMAIYTLVIPGLRAGEVSVWTERLKPLESFIRDRYMPFDVFFKLRIRDLLPEKTECSSNILDYNCITR